MNRRRLTEVVRLMAEAQLDVLAIVPGPNLFYLTGIKAHLSERPMVFFIERDGEPAMISPRFEAMKAEAVGLGSDRIFAWSDEEGSEGAFARASHMLRLSNRRIGVESLQMRVFERDLLDRFAPGALAVAADPLLATMRAAKDAEEVRAIERSLAVAERVFERLIPQITIGMTEKQIAAQLTLLQLEEGADSLTFNPIVQAGPSSESPHGTPTARPIQAGDLLILDWGCILEGYASDITRTLAVGSISAQQRQLYDTVLEANRQATAIAQPGASGQDVDRVARAVITAAGYGPYFLHRTGHGLGLEGHEHPYMVEGNVQPLVPGNFFTVEPGAYVPGLGGVRIEDNILITESGHRVLTTLDRALLRVG